MKRGDSLFALKQKLSFDRDYFQAEIVHEVLIEENLGGTSNICKLLILCQQGNLLMYDDKALGLDYGLPDNAFVESYLKPAPVCNETFHLVVAVVNIQPFSCPFSLK